MRSIIMRRASTTLYSQKKLSTTCCQQSGSQLHCSREEALPLILYHHHITSLSHTTPPLLYVLNGDFTMCSTHSPGDDGFPAALRPIIVILVEAVVLLWVCMPRSVARATETRAPPAERSSFAISRNNVLTATEKMMHNKL